MYKNKYTYPELVRVEKNDVRYYRDSKENLVPSVTTILSATGDKSGIDAWKPVSYTHLTLPTISSV